MVSRFNEPFLLPKVHRNLPAVQKWNNQSYLEKEKNVKDHVKISHTFDV